MTLRAASMKSWELGAGKGPLRLVAAGGGPSPPRLVLRGVPGELEQAERQRRNMVGAVRLDLVPRPQRPQPPDQGTGLPPVTPIPAPSPPLPSHLPALRGREEFTWKGRSVSPRALGCGPPGVCGAGSCQRGAEGQPDASRASISGGLPGEIAQASHPNLYGSGDFL